MVVKMKAFRRCGRKHWAARVQRVAIPVLKRGQVLIRVIKCGGCGSDLHVLNCAPGSEGFPARVTFGHEAVGIVVAVGAGVKHLKVGDRVVLVAIQGCGKCEFCTANYMQLCQHRRVQGLSIDGAMAEFVAVDERFAKKVPKGLTDLQASLLEPGTIASHCADVLGDVKGKRVFCGGAGIISVLCALTLKDRGAIVTMSGLERDLPTRLKKAKELGFPTVVIGGKRPSAMAQFKRLNGGNMADILCDASGAPEALVDGYSGGYHSVVRPGGEIMMVAIYERPIADFRPTAIVRFERRLTSSYGSDPSDYDKAAKLMLRGVFPVDQLVAEYPLDRAFQAYEDAASSRVLKPVVNCSPA